MSLLAAYVSNLSDLRLREISLSSTACSSLRKLAFMEIAARRWRSSVRFAAGRSLAAA